MKFLTYSVSCQNASVKPRDTGAILIWVPSFVDNFLPSGNAMTQSWRLDKRRVIQQFGKTLIFRRRLQSVLNGFMSNLPFVLWKAWLWCRVTKTKRFMSHPFKTMIP